MKFKCFLVGHKDRYEIVNKEKFEYKTTCHNCGKISYGNNKRIINHILSNEYYNRYVFAWDALKGLFPASFKEDIGKTKHVLSFHSDGKIVFRVDLRPEEINILRAFLIETDPGYSNWNIVPVLNVAK